MEAIIMEAIIMEDTITMDSSYAFPGSSYLPSYKFTVWIFFAACVHAPVSQFGYK